MQKFNVEIETLSPIHIWNGNYLSLLDFLVIEADENYFVYKFNQNKLVRNLSENLQNEYLEVLEKNDFIEIKDFFYKNLGKLQEIVKDIYYSKIKTNKSFYDKWYDKLKLSVDDCEWDTYEAKLNDFYNKIWKFEIQEFINQKWKFYIPWSSLKGAIRSCLISEKDNWEIQEDPFKYLIVRDSNFIENWIFLKEKWRLHNDINKALEINEWDGTYFEYLALWKNFDIEIIIKEIIDENVKVSKDFFSKETLIEKINDYTKTKIEKYLKQLWWYIKNEFKYKESKNKWLIDYYRFDEQSIKDREAKIEKLVIIKQNLEYILDRFNDLEKNECILNLWFGWWYWFKCFSWGEKHPDKKLQKSRWQIARTSWKVFENWINEDNEQWENWENLWFIKLTFKD